jgi:hypothetical protein
VVTVPREHAIDQVTNAGLVFHDQDAHPSFYRLGDSGTRSPDGICA